jgi:hypothetical protein
MRAVLPTSNLTLGAVDNVVSVYRGCYQDVTACGPICAYLDRFDVRALRRNARLCAISRALRSGTQKGPLTMSDPFAA